MYIFASLNFQQIHENASYRRFRYRTMYIHEVQ